MLQLCCHSLISSCFLLLPKRTVNLCTFQISFFVFRIQFYCLCKTFFRFFEITLFFPDNSQMFIRLRTIRIQFYRFIKI